MFTVDDLTLLRAIAIIESEEVNTVTSSALTRLLGAENDFNVLHSNDHLRGLLKTFLIANVAVESKSRDVSRHKAKGLLATGIIGRISGEAGKLKDLQDELTILKAIRDEAYKPYEMLRKLTDNENNLLKRVLN